MKSVKRKEEGRWTAIGALLLLSLSLPILGGLVPRSVTLEGRVLNRASDRPVPGAAVRLLAVGERASTDEAGRFSFGGREVPGPDTLLVSHPDFMPMRVPLGMPDDDAWELEIMLMPGSTPTSSGGPQREEDRR